MPSCKPPRTIPGWPGRSSSWWWSERLARRGGIAEHGSDEDADHGDQQHCRPDPVIDEIQTSGGGEAGGGEVPGHGERLSDRSDEHTPELQLLMRISYAVF